MAGLAGGRYITFGKPYVHMLAALIKDKKKVNFVDGKSEVVEITPEVKKFLIAAEKSNEVGVAKALKVGVKFNPLFNGRKWTEVDKKQFTGKGGGAGAGAYVTKLTESLQCYYCAYVFNISKKKVDSISPEQLQQAARFTDTDAKLDECLKKGPIDWIESGVYTKTANAIFDKYKTGLTGASYWHRGSSFMKSIYKSKGVVHKMDKATGNAQAPGSFSDDKWNPGDIWATTTSSVKPFANHEDSWGELNNAVLGKAGVAPGSKTTILAVSLKKIAPNAPAKIEEFNKTRPSKLTYKHKSFSFGRTGDFFGAIDAYIITSEGSVQFRNFSGEMSWQGEIKGKAASGGKIGGANVAFYLEDVFKQKLFGRHGSERGVIAAAKSDPAKHAQAMYDIYARHNAKTSPHKPLLTSDEFIEKWNSATQAFRNSKTMCLYLVDIIMSGTAADRDLFVTKMFRYAQSNTDQSSYFIKVY